MGVSSGHHLLSLHRRVSIVLQRKNNQNFSEPKQIYRSMATANISWQDILNWFNDIFRA